jgi:hypothetical protein
MLHNARSHQLVKLVAEAERAIAALSGHAEDSVSVKPESPVPHALEPLAERVRSMRESLPGVR